MDTKWKNVKEKWKKMIESVCENRHGIIGGLCLAAGAVLLIAMFGSFHRMYTRQILLAGCVMNLLLVIGQTLCLQAVRRIRERKGDEGFFSQAAGENYENYYPIWAEQKTKQEKRLNTAAVLLLIAAGLFVAVHMYLHSAYFYMNYAFFYLLPLTILLQYVVCGRTLARQAQEKLDAFIASMQEINRKRVMRALEVEKESLARAAKSEQLKVDLISNVSHDLKTPLTSMVGYLELLKKEELGETARDYVEVIGNRAEKLKEMINSLFSLAKASSGNIELHREELSLNTLLEQILADMKDQIDASGLAFVLDMEAEPDKLYTDNAYLYRICQNLIENALKYSAKGTRIFLKTFIAEQKTPIEVRKKLCFEIVNTSAYPLDFSKEDIVERFARGDKARSTEGNGLGLAIVSTYAGALGADFDIEPDCDQFRARLEFPLDGGN